MIKIFYKKIVVTLLFFITIFLILFANLYNIKISINQSNTQIITKSIIKNDNLYNNINNTKDNLLPNKSTFNDKLNNKDEVYLGGIPIGIKAKTEGIIIVGFNINDKGKISNLSNKLKIGDIITSANNTKVNDVEQFVDIMNKVRSENITLAINRNNEYFDINVPIFTIDNSRQIGLKVKDTVMGIGTLTYVDNNRRFASLGHHIVDSDSGLSNSLNKGEIYQSFIVNSTKGKFGKAGHLNGLIVEQNNYGVIDKNCCYGLYGRANNQMVNRLCKIKIAKRNEIRLGKAKIYTTVKGIKPRLYDVEIIKTYGQNVPKEKGMIIRVVDKELIALTGGILQGMSGSPILQNGKLVGALTHVFLNDAKKGYGLYVDWMLSN